VTFPQNKDSDRTNQAPFPLRDWILLPGISLLTVCILLLGTEFVARRLFSESKTSTESCLVLDDKDTGVRGVPNSVCREKVPEDQLVEYRFDNCGYRSGMQCVPKVPGTYRIVMTGSSIAIGERVPIDKTFATLLPQLLTERTGRRIELYNEGMPYGFPRTTALRFQDVLARKPDMVLWVLTPADIGEGEFVFAENAAESGDAKSKIWSKLKEAVTTNSILDRVRNHVEHSRTGLMLQHFLYKNESEGQYVTSYLMGPDRVIGFLRSNMSPEWRVHLAEFEVRSKEIAARSADAGVTFVAVFLPNRAQSAMLAMGIWPSGYDPYALNRELGAIIVKQRGIFIDVLPGFRSIANPEQYYLPVDGHPTADAHAIFSKLMADGLTGGAVQALKSSTQNQVAMAKGR
jgi:hypothetical protein